MIFFHASVREDSDAKNAYDRRRSKKKSLTNSPSKGRRACDVKASTTPSRAVLAPEDPAPGVGRHGRLRERRECWACVCSRLDVASVNVRDVNTHGGADGGFEGQWCRSISKSLTTDDIRIKHL